MQQSHSPPNNTNSILSHKCKDLHSVDYEIKKLGENAEIAVLLTVGKIFLLSKKFKFADNLICVKLRLQDSASLTISFYSTQVTCELQSDKI